MSTPLAPIALFAYKRPKHLKRALQSLAANPEAVASSLIIYCDGPREHASAADLAAIAEVRKVAATASGFASLRVQEAATNKGLARSVMEGVSDVLGSYGRVIVVEDDVELSPYFLRFMNDALATYADDDRVGAIGSWPYFMPEGRSERNFFLDHPDSIAWATWSRAWAHFEPDGRLLLDRLQESGRHTVMDAGLSSPYYTNMLHDQIEGRVDSWAIRWTASCILKGMLTLYPERALSKHMGFGEGATHETGATDYNGSLQLADTPVPVSALDPLVLPEAQQQWSTFVQNTFAPPATIKDRVWRALPRPVQQWYKRNRSTASDGPAQLAFPPVSRVFGFDRGTPVDRYYIERFLNCQQALVRGNVMEISESTYTQRFASGPVVPWVLLYQGDAAHGRVIGDLAKLETLPAASMDTFICTQTLNFIYDVHAAVRGLHHVLKPGGTALVTVAGLVQVSRFDAERWGDFWRFTPSSAQRMFAEVFGAGNIGVQVFGNSYAAACLMKGFATEECDKQLLDQSDADYPVVIAISARKA